MNEYENIVGHIKQCMNYVRVYNTQELEASQLYLGRAKRLLLDKGVMLSYENIEEFIELHKEFSALEMEVA